MAKKKQAKQVNKSAEIRAYLAAHPNVKLADAAAALSRKGVDVTPQYISVVKSADKKKVSIKRGRPRSTARQPASASVSVDSMMRAKKFVKELGSIDEAKRALDTLAKLID